LELDGRLVTFQVQDHHGTQVAGTIPLLVGDAWEHAYYLDYRNEKEKWAKAFLQLADWQSASQRYRSCPVDSRGIEMKGSSMQRDPGEGQIEPDQPQDVTKQRSTP
jgi:hypothetical protein